MLRGECASGARVSSILGGSPSALTHRLVSPIQPDPLSRMIAGALFIQRLADSI